jgi:hypothetical protein
MMRWPVVASGWPKLALGVSVVPATIDLKLPLDVSSANPEFLGKMPENDQELVPILEVEPNSTRVRCNGADFMEQLPDTNVDNSVTFGIKEHENRRRHWY